MKLPASNSNVNEWRSVRVGPVLHRGQPDLVVVGSGTDSSYLSIFKSIDQAPYFDFSKPFYTTKFPYATPDIELLDVNKDSWYVWATEIHCW